MHTERNPAAPGFAVSKDRLSCLYDFYSYPPSYCSEVLASPAASKGSMPPR